METGFGDRTVEELHYPLDRDIDAVAADLGLTAVIADDYLIQLDIDSPTYDPTPEQRNAEAILEENVGFLGSIHTKSKSGNVHVYYVLRDGLSLSNRIAFQAALGSDPKREALGIARVLKGVVSPVALFETPEEYKRVREFIDSYDNAPPF